MMLRWILASVLMLFTIGCTSPAARVKITPVRNDRTFIQDFSQAYITREPGGDYQIALLADPIDAVNLGKPGAKLNEASVSPLRQIILIRVLWRPMKGQQFDFPVASNSVLHWYIFDRTAAEAGWVHYAGNAFVAVYPQSTHAEVQIRQATVTIVERCGSLVDPLGTSGLVSEFDARSDDYRVAMLQKEAKSLVPLAEARKLPATQPTNQPPMRGTAP